MIPKPTNQYQYKKFIIRPKSSSVRAYNDIDMTITILRYEPGSYRSLRANELENCGWLNDPYNDYCFVVTVAYYVKLKLDDESIQEIVVPERMLSDGATGVKELGTSYIVHDYLYAFPYFVDGTPCSRKLADDIMGAISRMENFGLFADALALFSWLNPLDMFSRAHAASSIRGLSFLPDHKFLY